MATSEELSSILMRMIRTLSEISESGEQREEQKKRLQRQFRESDHALDHLVFKRQKDLTRVTQVKENSILIILRQNRFHKVVNSY